MASASRLPAAALLLACLLPACDDPAEPPAPPDPLVRIEDEPPGDRCPEGGTAVHVGLDADGDGALDDGEIASTTWVCDPDAAVRVDDEPAGDHCALGGRAIHSGPDRDEDGALDDDEIAETVYVCNDEVATLLTRTGAEPAGANCAAGGTAIHSGLDLDGDATLDDGEVVHTDYVCDQQIVTRIDVEAPGANCLTGGAAVHTGEDLDGDGALDPGEVTATEYVCDGVVVGDLVLEVPADTIGLDEVEIVTGDLRAAYQLDLTAIALPALRVVGGDLVVESCDHLASLSAPALATVGGVARVSRNDDLAALDLSGLAGASQVEIHDNPLLTALDLGALEQAMDGVSIRDNPIASLDLDQLRYVGALHLWDLETSSVELPVLFRTDDFYVVGGALSSLSAPQLDFVLGNLVLADNPALPGFTLPTLELVADKLIVRDHDVLTTFSLPTLTTVGGELDLWDNAALTGLSIPQLQAVGGWLYLAGNPSLASLQGLSGVRTIQHQFLFFGDTALDDLSDLTQLRRIGGALQVGNTTLRRLALPNLTVAAQLFIGNAGNENPLLETLDLPALRETDALQLHYAPLATRFDLPALVAVWGAIGVSFDDTMPTCRVDALLEQLAVVPDQIDVFHTDDDAPCP
jgi:hypothetical protein